MYTYMLSHLIFGAVLDDNFKLRRKIDLSIINGVINTVPVDRPPNVSPSPQLNALPIVSNRRFAAVGHVTSTSCPRVRSLFRVALSR